MAVDPDIYVYAKNPLDIKYRLGQDVEGNYLFALQTVRKSILILMDNILLADRVSLAL